ncbi:MAG: amidohydrolase [Bryobacteraceae bacterium]
MNRLVLALSAAVFLHAQPPETILINGKILTVDARNSIQQALAIRDGKITALGTTAAIRPTAAPSTRIIDLGGRTVIPGLIDSHMHAIRAALSFSTEVNWIGARSIPEAMRRISAAAKAKPAGSWLIVAGGWTADQFTQRRAPTQAELIAAAPMNPVYVQLGYSWAILTPAGYAKLGELPPGLTPDAKNPGAVNGGQPAIVALFDKLPKPTPDQQLEGTKLFFTELNRLGITGVVDPGGNNLFPSDYQAVQTVWRNGQLSVRVAFSLGAQIAGDEFNDFQNQTRFLPAGFGDDYLRFTGIGERITATMNNNDRPTADQKEKYLQIARWAAARGMALTMHWPNNSSVGELLGIFETVNKDIPITDLRWSIAHLGDASEATMQRMKSLGIGWTMQNGSYFGASPNEKLPALNTARRVGLHVGAGTDAHRVMSYNPFSALQWMLDGKTVAGAQIAGMTEVPSREEALRLYTLGSAWFSKDDTKRGSLEVGKYADLVVLTKDYLTIPVSEIGNLESVLTIVGGKAVFSASPF